MATVTIIGLNCGVTYTIIAGGTNNGDLVGPISVHDNVTQFCLSSAPREEDGGNHYFYFFIYQKSQH